MSEIKRTLYRRCMEFIESRIQTARTALVQAQEAANDDTKSSAGDKYETGREMMQQEIDRNKKLLADAAFQLQIISALNPDDHGAIVKKGSLVYTDQGNFYLSIGVGQLHHDNISFFAISPASPIGSLFLGKSAGDSFDFNAKRYRIEAVE